MTKRKVKVRSISTMLSYKRPRSTYTERQFIKRYLKPLGMKQDAAGNLYKRIGTAPIMYACHTDTVDWLPGFRNMVYLGDMLMLHPKETARCLGADDGAGVWLMREMILAKRPGLYVFHRGEESGCIGSKWLSKNMPEMVKDIMAVISFDRRGTSSVITHQVYGRCCSDLFGNSLAKALGMGHKLDTGGSITDSAQYMDLVGECTNVSVGYQNEHSSSETLDMGYLTDLREAMLDFDWTKLAFSRQPGDYEPRYGFGRYSSGNKKHWWQDEDEKFGSYNGKHVKRRKKTAEESWSEYYKDDQKQLYLPKPDKDEKIITLSQYGYEDPEETKADRDRALMIKMVRDNPEEVADLLEDYGLDIGSVADSLFAKGGTVPSEIYGGYGTEEDDRA